jgi:DNA-binding transcriptional ArsR family regulator
LPSPPAIPDAPAHLLAVVREPRRLEILLALEQEPRSVVDLARALGLTYPEADWAVKALLKGNLIALQAGDPLTAERPRGRGADLVKVYETRHTEWQAMVRALTTIAASASQDT